MRASSHLHDAGLQRVVGVRVVLRAGRAPARRRVHVAVGFDSAAHVEHALAERVHTLHCGTLPVAQRARHANTVPQGDAH